ncbi:MAG: winged helix-turn-helix domain-containing protein [Treponemataceae bacterium]|nr:winged helix-turn-helix domain-containing protein [Treponemataceae bacterium]
MRTGYEKTLYLFRVSPVLEEWIRRRKLPCRVCCWVPIEEKNKESKEAFVKDCLFLLPFEELAFFRKIHLSVPFITFGRVEYIARAFKAGACDYLPFPFNTKEFDSRVEHVLKDLENVQKGTFLSPLWLDRNFLIGPTGKVYLSPCEATIMEHLLYDPFHRLIRKSFYAENKKKNEQIRSIDVYISRLRKKLKIVCFPQAQATIRSIRGTGYLLEYQETSAKEKSSYCRNYPPVDV